MEQDRDMDSLELGRSSTDSTSTFAKQSSRYSNSNDLLRRACSDESSASRNFSGRLPMARTRRSIDIRAMTCIERIMASQAYETVGGCIVLINFLFMTVETHARAVDDRDVLSVATFANRVILAIYIVESGIRLFTQKCDSFKNMWNILDYLIVVEGVTGEIMEIAALQLEATNQMGMLKSLRMIRLIRLLRLLVAFPELHVLAVCISGCMKTLFWAVCLIFSALNVWSILSVEYLSSVAQDMDDAGEFATCKWCRTAFSNVWLANLTWFQIVTGDGWSILARGMIENHPWTCIFFMTNIVVIMWGLLNLVVAAIVEASMEARESDVTSAAKMALLREEQAFEGFSSMCRNMDKSGDGVITIDEFKDFYENSGEFKRYLAAMGVTEANLASLLRLMDKDQNGMVENTEFVEQMTRMRTLVMKTEIFSVARYTERIYTLLRRQARALEQLIVEVDKGKLGLIENSRGLASLHSRALARGTSPQFDETDLANSVISSCASKNAMPEGATQECAPPTPRGYSYSTRWEPIQWDYKAFEDTFDTFFEAPEKPAVPITQALEDVLGESFEVSETVAALVSNSRTSDSTSLGCSGGISIGSTMGMTSGKEGRCDFEFFEYELGSALGCIMKRLDELPEAITTEVLKHVRVTPP